MEEKEKIEKSVEELKRIWEGNEKKMRSVIPGKVFSFFLSLPLPETPTSFLERISNKFLKEFDWEKFKRRKNLEGDLGLFLSAFLKKNIGDYYVLSQKKKGIKESQIEPIKVHLDVKELPVCLDYLGWQNPRKLHLIIEGNCGRGVGTEMRDGGEIIVRMNCGNSVGSHMQGGKIIVRKDCGEDAGYWMRGGKIIIKGNCGSGTGRYMQGGEVIVEGSCGRKTGIEMKGGKLDIKEVKSFYALYNKSIFFPGSAFSSNNKGIIILGGIEIWRDGSWTKVGKEMWKRGWISVS
ncbi:hypothetical protein J7J41_02155 [bacterium]|nr:hypothetical protein [bacterium]